MPNISIQLPPGCRRNGTLYQAKGRWYGANLVRWQEGAMQPIGGWERRTRNDAPDLSAGIEDDGTVFTDYTTEINEATAADVQLAPASPAENDAFYFALSFPFSGIMVEVSTMATDGAWTWEYYNGSAWVALSNVTDNSENFQHTDGAGNYTISWAVPTDWEANTVNSQGPFYYVRMRVSTAGTSPVVGSFADMFITPLYLGEDDVPRGAIGWKDNGQNSLVGFGTADYLYIFSGAFLYDITPAGFTAGGRTATSTAGAYGDGAYGAGPYGTGDVAAGTLVEAQTWQLDTFGEDLIACAYSDGKLYLWDLSVGGATPAAVVGASRDPVGEPPIENVGVFVTPERFVVALGGRGQVAGLEDAAADARRVIWSDQEDAAEWSPIVAGSSAGDFILPGAGELMCGARNRNESLIWTDVDLFSMRFIGGTLVYSFQQTGANCGIISRHAHAEVDGRSYWMSHRGFFQYDGFAQPVACEISDDIFNNLNRTQRSKIFAFSVSEYREIWFCYPSAGSEEIDTVVAYNYVENHWSGPWGLERTAGFDRGAFDFPMAFDALGQMYYHETGEGYLWPDRTDSYVPTAETGPIEIGQGDQVMTVNKIIPDEVSLGSVDMTMYAALYPTAAEDEQAITTLTEPTSCRITGRQVRLKVIQDDPGWRVGAIRLEVIGRGKR